VTIHIDTDYSLIPPYAVMIIFSCTVGLVLQFFINVKRGIEKRIAGYVTVLAPCMSILAAVLLTYISSGGKMFGLSSLGGLFGMYAAAFTVGLIVRDRGIMKLLAEDCTLVLPLMYSIAKVGCFLAGCCRGIPWDGPLCAEYTGRITGTFFPVQLAETVVFFLIFVLGAVMFLRGAKNTVMTVFIASAAAKGGLDVLRESHIGKILSLNQILCALLIVAGIAVMIYGKRTVGSKQDSRI